MDESSTKPPPRRAHLVQQDIQLTREARDGKTRVVARVECARRCCTIEVEQCARCPHFVRIDTHEAGYLLLCQAGQDVEDGNESPKPTTERGTAGQHD